MEPIPLSNAFLCAECEFVVNESDICPKCGSKALLSIARLVGGYIGKDTTGVAREAEPLSGIERNDLDSMSNT